MDFQNELNGLKRMLNLRNLNQDPPHYSHKGKSIVDDLVPIPKESEVTSDSISECDMSTPLPTTDVGEEDFDINSPLGEQVVDFLMENVDVAGLPRHLVKRLFSHLLKNPSLTKGMSDEPVGDDSKPRSYNVTFSNLLFDFNDDCSLCYDNLFFDKEFEDISSLDLLELTLVIDESTLLTSDLILEELTTEIILDGLISTDIDDRYYDLEDDILYFEQLLNEDSSSDVSLALLPTKSSLLVSPFPDPKLSLREVERFDPFFSLTQSGRKTRVMETPSFSFHRMPSPRPAAYSPTKVMYCYHHPHLTSGDGFDHGPKMK
nr:hypothetical protein [Tanacetum cinerariifolium]